MTNPMYPFPEAIERSDIEGAFEIEQGSYPSTDLAKRKMVVPTGGVCIECGEDHARAMRLREMGHTAWTPSDWEARVKRTKDKLPMSLVAACEVGRINIRRVYAKLEKIPAALCAKDDDYYFTLRQILRNDDLLALMGVIVASYHSDDETPVNNALIRLLDEMLSKTDEREQIRAQHITGMLPYVRYAYNEAFMYGSKPNFRATLALARALMSQANATAKAINTDLDQRAEMKAAKVREYEGKGKRTRPKGTRFGKMSIVRLPLTRRSKAGLERRWTARDEGPIPTRFDRWSIDKRVFRTKKRSKGAALLIDVSGSMSWHEDDLRQVLEEVPAATIAIYSGTGTTGKLIIVAEKGKCATMTTATRYVQGGNVIDGPALEWLSEQPETVKLWMSDGGITGMYDGDPGDDAPEYCSKLLRKGQIQQVRDAEEVIAILSGKRPFVPSRAMRYM